MTEKIKVTQAQKEWLDEILTDENADYAINIQPLRKRPDSPIVEWPASKLAKAFYIGYEVEETFKVGDWITHKRTEVTREVTEETESFINEDYVGKDDIRHATPEEIKAEKERRVWKSIGREVGGFREGDIGIFKNEYVDHVDALEVFYKDGVLTGFYPAESFIKFGGAEE